MPPKRRITSEEGYKEALKRIDQCRLRKEHNTTLDLSELELITVPPEIGQLTSLQVLRLETNKLTTLPQAIGQLKSLVELHVGSNHLNRIPPEIGQLHSLSELHLGKNDLAALPQKIGQLKKLSKLYLGGNRLTSLPPDIGQLTSLSSLYLQGNQLNMLPKEIKQLTGLSELYLHGNAELGLPVEVLGATWNDVSTQKSKPKLPAEILASYFRIVGDAGEPLGECKLIVVGRGQAGKTSLIKRLRYEPYNPQEQETHGITIQRLEFEFPGQPSIHSRVWDFGGQVVLHSMHELFLTARSLYLLVLGERDDMLERDATYWLQLIRSYAGNVPVVVALNKSAGRQRQFDPVTLEQNYGPILGWVSTECSETDEAYQDSIDELRKTLARALESQHMDSVRRKFPKKWRKIKASLENMTESYMEYDRYTKRCKDHGEPDPNEQAALASDLHDLGVALNYSKDARLRDTTVLRPDWLANGIYAVLRANDRDEKLPPELNIDLAPGGVIDASSLEQIHLKAQAWKMLKATDYPPGKRDFLLRLMDLFHLSYPLNDSGQKQLVPTLLPLNPPSGSEEPTDENRIRLRYEFHVVPAPLIPWFIARTFALIPPKLQWRRGAMLHFDDARAKVWVTQDERYVFVTVAGSDHSQKRLLAIIRGTLHKVFREYKALAPVEQWDYKSRWVPRETLEEFGVLPRETHESDPDRLSSDEASL